MKMLALLFLGIFHISLTNAFMADTLKCDEGWIQFDGCCYIFGETEETHEKARAICQSKSANLVEPLDGSLNWFVQNEQGKLGRQWLGFNAIADKGIVRLEYSQNKLADSEYKYRNWHPKMNIHHHPGTHCVVMDEDGYWVFADCDNVEAYACELENCVRESLLSQANEKLKDLEEGDDDDDDEDHKRGGPSIKLPNGHMKPPRVKPPPSFNNKKPSNKNKKDDKKKKGKKDDKKKKGKKDDKKKKGKKDEKKKH